MGVLMLFAPHRIAVWRMGCKHSDEAQNEAAGTRMTSALLARWVESGSLPAQLKELDAGTLPDTLRYWKYLKQESDFPSFQLVIGDYDACGWETMGGFECTWLGGSNPAARAEARQLLQIALKHHAAHGAWPANHDALGLPSDWGDHGPWEFTPPPPPKYTNPWLNKDGTCVLRQITPAGPQDVLEFDVEPFWTDGFSW